jgi:tetratricopeptide (TPR) repeat protein
MDAVTYPRPETERLLTRHFVPLRLPLAENADMARRFDVRWTPAFVVLDDQEKDHYRAFGYHPPEDFEHLLRVARGTIDFSRGDYSSALAWFATAADDVRDSALRPEALYWQGVCRYKLGDKDGMSQAWNRLLDHYPKSLWARRASFIRSAA